MTEVIDKKAIFLSHGIKNTKQRNLVFDILNKSDCPISAENIFSQVTSIDPTINLSTIYRVLETFVTKGLVLKSSMMGSNNAAFELNRRNHKHQLICLRCNKTIPIDFCPLKSFQQSIEETTDFDITGHNLEMFGYCPECKEKMKKNKE